MNFLLDTHVFLWALFGNDQLSESAAQIIINPENSIFISTITFWEISLKYSTGKLSLHNISPDILPDYAEKSGFEILPVTSKEVATFYRLPKLKHKDPFDRLIIWQCIQQHISLISSDHELSEYEQFGLKIAW
jgi:PIN domain nuclease of toxin-antitoxin system